MVAVLPSNCASGNWLARICGLETRVTVIEERLDGLEPDRNLADGIVMLQREGHGTLWFVPETYSAQARQDTLKAAMQIAAEDPDVEEAIVTLLYGDFPVTAGQPITSYAPANAIIVFGERSAVIYADENDAASDPRLYPGQQRYARNFGAGAPGVADNQPRIQAALFSMPSRNEPIYQPAKYPALKTRTGILYLEAESYPILNSIWITGYQSIIGLTGFQTIIALPDGFAPESGDEKFGIETACYLPGGGAPYPPGGQGGANFTFNIHLHNLVIANQSFANTKASALRYGCAQGGSLRIVTSSMGQRGIYMLPNTCHVEVHHWGVANASGALVQKGPHLSGDSCYNCHFRMVSEEHLNNSAIADHISYTIGGSTVPLACIMFSGSHNMRFESCAGESNGNYAYFKSCHGTKIGNIDHAAAEISGNGDCVVWFDNCLNSGFDNILCSYFATAYKATTFGASSLSAANGVGFYFGPFNTTGDTFIAIAGNPTAFHVPPNSSRDVRNTSTGIASRWINNGGVLQSIAYT